MRWRSSPLRTPNECLISEIMAKRKVLLIYTGGTIGMVRDLETGVLKPFDFDHMTAQVPELKLIDAELESISFEHPIDSSNMSPEVWTSLVKIIEDHYTSFDGFVILHGSDTMAHTASALSFMIENLNKPIILTGSQLPIGLIRTDGKENLITAIEIAATYNGNQAMVPEVCIYFEYKLYRGNRTHKYNAEHFKAFRSSNYPLLAEAGVHVEFNHPYIHQPEGGTTTFTTNLDNGVFILKLFPGISEDMVRHVLRTPGMKALVLETFGSGNAPSAMWFLQALAAAINDGLIVLNVSQCGEGAVEQGRYETSSALEHIGVIGGADITSESACAKLMFLLANRANNSEIIRDLKQSLRGEISEV
jgi:L-asparaginase